jgi:hypothetical protein
MKTTTFRKIAIYYYWLVIGSALAVIISLCSCTYRINRNCEVSIS